MARVPSPVQRPRAEVSEAVPRREATGHGVRHRSAALAWGQTPCPRRRFAPPHHGIRPRAVVARDPRGSRTEPGEISTSRGAAHRHEVIRPGVKGRSHPARPRTPSARSTESAASDPRRPDQGSPPRHRVARAKVARHHRRRRVVCSRQEPMLVRDRASGEQHPRTPTHARTEGGARSRT